MPIATVTHMAMILARNPRVLASIVGTSSISISRLTAGWNGFPVCGLPDLLEGIRMGRALCGTKALPHMPFEHGSILLNSSGFSVR